MGGIESVLNTEVAAALTCVIFSTPLLQVVLARYLELATPSTTGTLSIRRQDENIYSQMKAKRLLSLA